MVENTVFKTSSNNVVIIIMTELGNGKPILGDGNEVAQLMPSQNAAISLPASLFETITDRENVGLFFALYDTSILFPVNGESNISKDTPRQSEVGSRIVATTVGPDLHFENLKETVTIILRLTNNVRFFYILDLS